MSIRFDEKGKFFTDIISKEAIPVIIQTVTHRIEGLLHIRPDTRLTDEVNKGEQFFAVTEASIIAGKDDERVVSEFFAINRDQIVWILPVDQIVENQSGGGEA